MPPLWYVKHPALLQEETSEIHRRFPDMATVVSGPTVRAQGRMPVLDDAGRLLKAYKVELAFPRDYPEWVPDLFMRDPGVEWIGDRHIEVTGRACLCLPHEVPRMLPNGFRLAPFLERLVRPWLLGQVHFDRERYWPYADRSHGRLGILEGLGEDLGIADPAGVVPFLSALFGKKRPKGHIPCPCSSGRRLRDCHAARVWELRKGLHPRAVRLYRGTLLPQRSGHH